MNADRDFLYPLDVLPKQITAAKGKRIVLKLSDYASAGYRWHIEQMPQGVIEILSQKVEKQDGVIGGGELYICFSVQNNGCLRFYLKRDWENRFYHDTTITVQIKEES